MLEVRHLTKHYGAVPVVSQVSFTIRPGEILGYLGPNGAGKSTTVKMLTGLLEPTSGHIFWYGQNVRQNLPAYQRRIGYVPEEPHLYPHLTGREYLQLVGRLRGPARMHSRDGRLHRLSRTTASPCYTKNARKSCSWLRCC
jgi:ABC-2 type transport system ATP-binding protein